MIQAKSKGRYSRYRDITEPFFITARIEGEKAVSKACPYQSQYAFIGIHKEKLRRMAGGGSTDLRLEYGGWQPVGLTQDYGPLQLIHIQAGAPGVGMSGTAHAGQRYPGQLME